MLLSLLIASAVMVLTTAVVLVLSTWRWRRDWTRTRLREKWLATMLRSIDDGVIATDAAGRVTFMNDVAQELTGWKESEAVQRPLVKVFHTVDRKTRQPAENPIDVVVREGTITSMSEPAILLARDGAERVVRSNAAPIRDDGGKVTGVVFTFRDVTERELAESALRASQEMFRLITDHISDFITVLDLEGRRLYSSASHAQLLAPPRGLYLASVFDGIHPDDRERVRAIFAEVVRDGIGRRVEYRVVGIDGKTFNLESLMTAVCDRDGQPEKILKVSRDISVRNQAREIVRQEKEFSDTLINSMPGIFYLYDARRKILRWNKNLETVTGYTAQEIDTLDPLTYFPGDERQIVHERMLKCFAEGSADIEVNLLAKDGRRTPFYVTGFRIDIDGQPCMLGIGINITARVEAEQALRELLDNLEIKVAARTRDLEAANERLQELDRLKSEFIATMSHELRTPLNSIIGFSGILRQGLAGPLNDEQKKQLGMVHSSARHLLGLINDLLDLSRIESGKMELFVENFGVAGLVNEVVQVLTPQAEQKRLRLESTIDHPECLLSSDRQRCFQILLNLANNAVKFTEAGRVNLRVSTGPEMVEFVVSDTGIGIKPENLQHLFEAFRQVDGSARRVYEGTGLGLYLSEHLARMLGGKISVESEFGIGSRFTLVLPKSVSPSQHPP
ncbi:MAG TPA: PAS domain S-box protein [Chthoniobacter sp.]